VTTPDQTSDPTTGANPVLYAKDTSNAGVIQYSRGISNAVPTPITNLQSTAAAIELVAGLATNVLDFTGINRAIGRLSAFDTVALRYVSATIFWTGAVFSFIGTTTSGSTATFKLEITSSGNILQILNSSGSSTLSNLYWTLELERMS